MVSPLWTAAAENDVENLRRLLADASVADVEITDGSGATPLIQAARAGHVDAVRALLDRGADPHHACAEGRPDQLAADADVLQLLHAALAARAPPPPPEGAPGPYWAPPPPAGMYGFYDAGAGPFFPPPFAGHMPPPDVARMIPCRFFPACRYGAGCLFAHPPAQGAPPPPFFQGAPPPAPYGHYDPAQAYAAPGYYPPPPPPMSPTAYPPPPHDPSSPVNGVPPQVQPLHGGPLSPVQVGFPPAPGAYPPPMAAGFPPQGMVPPPGAPMYAPVPPPVFPPPPQQQQQQQQQQPQQGGPASPPANGPGHNRRGSTRRPPSFANSRKPPCIFFPSGRCKNGDECRFPHVLPDGPVNARGPLRPRYPGANGFGGIDEKMAGLALDNRGGPRGFAGPQARPRASPPLKQRLPGADEFPTLNGTAPPSRGSPPASATALTAAQVLQAPAPVRESKPASSAGSPSGSVNGDVSSASEPDVKPEAAAVAAPPPLPKVAVKLPLSFAAAANSAVVTTPELSVSA